MSSALQLHVPKDTTVIGKPLRRLEDPKFVTGAGKFVDDIKLAGMLHAVFVRSLEAHARIANIDVSRALENQKVRLVLTSKELRGLVGFMPTVYEGEETKATKRPVLPITEVNYVGEPIAAVVAEDAYSAEDAAELVEVKYEPLPVVIDPEKGLERKSPRVHEYLPDNIGYHYRHEKGEVVRAFKDADTVVKVELLNQLVAAVPLETRGVVASFDRQSRLLTLWLSTQSPHEAREELAEVLRLPETSVRVISPDVGGAFGSKIAVYPEEAVLSVASMKFGLPIKWIETRRENLLATSHGRGQKQFIEAAVRKDGKILGLKVRIVADAGAYSIWGSVLLPESTIRMAPGLYDIPAFKGEVFSVFTNKVPQDAYRGAGRPEAAYLIERTMNVIASKMKLDPVKIRLKNFIPRDHFPFTTITDEEYDSGDYKANLERALEFSRYDQMRKDQKLARASGRLVGIGLVTYVEVCGYGPNYPQTASVTVTAHGSVVVNSGTNPQGQGHMTPFAQIVSEMLGVEVRGVTVNYGDTNMLPWSTVTAGSRSSALGGSAVWIAARRIREKMARIAARKLGVKAERMMFKNGRIYSPTSPSRSLKFAEVAELAYEPERLPPGMEASLFEYCAYAPSGYMYPYGTHLTMVEVDRETGLVRILKYVAVDDFGRLVNPLVVEGQVQGGVVQGIGQALLEGIVYDENGQLLTSTLADYLMPSSDTSPDVKWYRTETPSPSNPLGVKGVGEAGTIAATPAVVNAVEDALRDYNVVVGRMPLTPEYVRSLIKK